VSKIGASLLRLWAYAGKLGVGAVAEILIENGWVLPMGDPHRCHAPGWVAVRAGRISAVGAGDAPVDQSSKIIDARDCVVMPGLVNGHTHLEQTFMRGLADDQPLSMWLSTAIQPLQAAMTPDDIYLASLLGMLENLKSGVTAVTQHHKITRSRNHVEAALHAAETVGLRVLFARGWRDSGGRGETPDQVEDEIKSLTRHWHGREDGRIHISSGPMEPQRCSSGTMRRMLNVARDLGLHTHIHVAETADEIENFQQANGVSEIDWLHSFAGLAPDVQLVHCVHVNDRELDLIARCGAMVVHCPVSNMRLASGIAPLSRMLERNIPVCLGTDGPASNDSQDMLETAKVASLAAKIATASASGVSTVQLLRMLTSAGATAVGLPRVGQLAAGMKADIAIIKLRDVRVTPVHRPEAALIYCCSGAQVQTVLVDGRVLVESGRLTMLDENALLKKCQQAGSLLLQRVIASGALRQTDASMAHATA
jgi:5-methylthioadenosine/S-adenosylhomocysteine deaminase